MKQIPVDKYNVAWFTISECIVRGEKVRALSLYRLLAHSIDDAAFTHQLKGDILLAFEDNAAIELYEQAAALYKKDDRLLEAVAVYEHLHHLEPENVGYLQALIDLYRHLRIDSKVRTYRKNEVHAMLQSGDLDEAHKLIEQFGKSCKSNELIEEHRQLVHRLLQKENPPLDRICQHGKRVIDGLLLADMNKELQQFLSTIQVLNSDCYLQLCEYLEVEYDYDLQTS